MSRLIRKSPYGSEKQAQLRMLELLSQTAEAEGRDLTAAEREILLSHDEMPDDVWQKTTELIRRTFEAERWEDRDNPHSFSGALEWAGDLSYPNIVNAAEKVACENALARPKLRGWQFLKDRLQLVGCGLLVVLLMFVIVTVAGFIFHWK